ncbi:MAG: SOS response-associated peptidase [Proteobacteria bacterium]|nr:MAG: SOS response-associated peptidase [Pseudomonadota bacterium]QKK11010.1 MAG: SOS response-associated peptidase [Pseudomonadota bacterium]
MCGRFNLITDAQGLVEFFNVLYCPELTPRYNIAPTQEVPAVVLIEGARQVVMLRWGLIPSWARDPGIGNRMINARAETAATKPSFRAAFRRRRCLIPASGFYEWQTRSDGKQPYHIHPAGGGLMAFAGLWEHWEAQGQVLRSCTILTTAANVTIAPVHDRMPVILDRADHAAWLAADASPEVLQALLRPCAENWLVADAVSRHVNSPANDDPACIQPLTQ